MRIIEQKMNQSITGEYDWKLNNTEVVHHNSVAYVYLYGNKIAEVGETWLCLYDGGCRSKTTKSRLNAILAHHGNGEKVYQKGGVWFISVNGEKHTFENAFYLG